MRDVVRVDWWNLPWITYPTSKPYVSLNDGAGNFTQINPGTYQLPDPQVPFNEAYGVAVGKLNADNLNDIVFAAAHGSNWGTAYDGGLTMVASLSTTPTFDWDHPAWFYVEDMDDWYAKPCFVQIGDLDKDGWNDVAVSCTYNGKLAVLLNTNEGPPP